MTTFSGVLSIIMTIKTTIRHVVGVGLRRIADILLADYPSEPTNVAKPEVQVEKSEATPDPKPKKRNHEPVDSKTTPLASSKILQAMLEKPEEWFKIKDLEVAIEISDKSIRRACGELVKLNLIILGDGTPMRYRISPLVERSAIEAQIAEFVKLAGPQASEVSEPTSELN